ncbi:hypothetical protein FOA52_004021 [Chlamydomonas sp. UWO 241]|nr:hypothetical protein FOA52_004021 [Chlamydomonas sp. UWO 241]
MVHEGILQEYDDSVPDGTVLACLQTGYQMMSRTGPSGSSWGDGGSDDQWGSESEGEGGHSGGEEEAQGAAVVRLVRPALVKVSMR